MLRYIPDFVFKSWVFWVALIVMILVIFLWRNGIFGKNVNQTLRPARMNRSDGRSQNHESLPAYGKASFTNGTSGISYSSEGRSGCIYYRNHGANFSLYYEFGGGNCVAWIDIPGPDKWEKITGLAISQRDVVLNEIGQQVVKDQVASGKGYYRIEGNALNIYIAA